MPMIPPMELIRTTRPRRWPPHERQRRAAPPAPPPRSWSPSVPWRRRPGSVRRLRPGPIRRRPPRRRAGRVGAERRSNPAATEASLSTSIDHRRPPPRRGPPPAGPDHRPSPPVQAVGAGPPDSGRGPGDQDHRVIHRGRCAVVHVWLLPLATPLPAGPQGCGHRRVRQVVPGGRAAGATPPSGCPARPPPATRPAPWPPWPWPARTRWPGPGPTPSAVPGPGPR